MTRKPAKPRACRHPKGDVSVLHSDAYYVEKWCAHCGALYESAGWAGQRSKWRLPATASKRRGESGR